MTVVPQGGDVARGGGGGSGTLYDVLDLILDRGLVIDVFVRVSLVGIEILKIDARVVVASVDTYLRFAEACNRLDLESGRKAPAQLTDVVGDTLESGAKGKSKGALGGAMEAVADSLTGGGNKRQADDDRAELEGTDAEQREPVEERRPPRRASRRERER